ncbi:MAG: CooT family nickel-binding protein [Deltaproteobacteria bacterium]
MSVILEDDQGENLIMKNVAELKVTPTGIQLNKMFERPHSIQEVTITRIDFLDGKVYLAPTKR